MKKILNYIFFILIIVQTIKSQENPPCTDCWNVPWSTTTKIEYFEIPECPNCTLSVEYWYRQILDTCRDHAAPIGTKDLQIKDVWGTPGCNLCFSLQQKFKIAKDSLLLKNIFTPITRPNFDTLWRVFQTSCWGEWWDVFDQIYKIRGCFPNDVCCWELFGIYSTNNTVDSVKRLKTHIQAPIPMWDGCNKWTTPCWFVCDTAHFPPPPPELMSIEGYNSNFYTKIIPSPNRGSFDLEFINAPEDNKEITIRFHNIEGKLIYEVDNISAYKGAKIKIDLNNQTEGIYHYKVTQRNRVIDYGNFVISK